ncbi:MAG: tRNA pseudouridine(55) synthase TruB [Bacteroidales bacterium]|nr:tRNA pseudouridine(55) synthase TruB [Bacteroidales bacterium]
MNPQAGEIFIFNKPYALTSFRVVSRVRGILCNRLGTKKLAVGHAGTLDPLATGVLIVCTGKATKQIDTLQAGTKEYIAQLRLGATTPSFDRETAEDQTFPTEHISRELIEQVLCRFKGRIEQVPPAFSAVKVDGKRAFKMARRGVDVELKPKVLVIDEIELLDCDLTPASAPPSEPPAPICIKHLSDDDLQRLRQQPPLSGVPTLTIRVVCSKGTYIRALARDIGEALGTGAYLSGLIRTRIGAYTLADCLDPDTFEQYVDEQGVVPSVPQHS